MSSRPECFECGEPSVEDHHVVPKSRGGTKTVPLCTGCHGLIHSIERYPKSLDHGVLVGAGTDRALARGWEPGRPRSLPEDIRVRVFREVRLGATPGEVAKRFNEEGVPTARGGKKWHTTTVKGVLKCGLIPANKRQLGLKRTPVYPAQWR